MERKALKQEILDKIKSDGILYGLVANALAISPESLPRVLRKNLPKLTQEEVTTVITERLKITKKELFTFIPITTRKRAAA